MSFWICRLLRASFTRSREKHYFRSWLNSRERESVKSERKSGDTSRLVVWGSARVSGGGRECLRSAKTGSGSYLAISARVVSSLAEILSWPRLRPVPESQIMDERHSPTGARLGCPESDQFGLAENVNVLWTLPRTLKKITARSGPGRARLVPDYSPVKTQSAISGPFRPSISSLIWDSRSSPDQGCEKISERVYIIMTMNFAQIGFG